LDCVVCCFALRIAFVNVYELPVVIPSTNRYPNKSLQYIYIILTFTNCVCVCEYSLQPPHTLLSQAIRRALRYTFEQHGGHLRALLDTGDALLVYCARPIGWYMYEWSVRYFICKLVRHSFVVVIDWHA
jgi:hypothetical protein